MGNWALGSFVCPVIIGRGRELEALDGFLSRNGPRGLLISGEAGIGKSRLASESIARAERSGFQVFRSGCFEHDRSMPYGPLVDLLRLILANRPVQEILDSLGPLASDVARLVPEIEQDISDEAGPHGDEQEQQKQRLFQALTRTFHEVATGSPTLVVVEDLHWCDENSLGFLLYLLRRPQSQSPLLVMTYRADETDHSLRSFLSCVDRERLANELRLSPLPLEDVEKLLRETLRTGLLHPHFVDTIYSATEGNPYFIEEVLKSQSASGDVLDRALAGRGDFLGQIEIPRSVAHLVQRRLEQLSPAARKLATLAAVAGRQFDFSLLQSLTGYSEIDLIGLIKEFIAAQLVTEESEDRFAFRHAFTTEAICSELLARERRTLHLEIGEALERLHGNSEDAVWELAYHFYQAGDWSRAMMYSEHAGRKAIALHAPRSAVEHLSNAIAAARHMQVEAPMALYSARGLAYQVLGKFDSARSDLETMLSMARSQEDRESEWSSLINLGFLWAGRDYGKAEGLFREALELAQDMGDEVTLGHSLNRLGNWYLNVGHPQDALGYHGQALAIFQGLNDTEGTAQTLDLMGMACHLGGDLLNGTRYYKQAVQLFQALDDRQGLVSGLSSFSVCTGGNIYYCSTTVPPIEAPSEALDACERAYRIACDIHWRSGQSYVLFNQGFVLGSYGRHAEALDCARASLRLAQEIEHQQWAVGATVVLGVLYADLLAYELAAQHLERAVALVHQVGSVFWGHTAAGILASVYVKRGDLEKASAVVEANDQRDTDSMLGSRLLTLALAELAIAKRNGQQALEILDRLYHSAPNAAEHGEPYGLQALRGEALVLLRRYDEAAEVLKQARDYAETRALLPLLWRLHASLGRAYRSMGRRTDARRELLKARDAIDRIASGLSDEALRRTFLERARQVAPNLPQPSARETARREYSDLTARELEVAGLVSQGMTNREIAETLVIGERTVETHVSNIMSKLGFNSRSHITSWAFEKGLAHDPA